MKLTRLSVCQEVDARLSQMQAKVRLPPNLLCASASVYRSMIRPFPTLPPIRPIASAKSTATR